MYSLIRHRTLNVRTKYFSRGERLRKHVMYRNCSLCRAIPVSTYGHVQLASYSLYPPRQDLRVTPVVGPVSRHLHTSFVQYNAEPLKPSSKIEQTVTALKEKAKESEADKVLPAEPKELKPVVKKTLWQKIKDEIIHYYHGFRLLGIDINVSRKLVWRIIRGNALTRREHKLLVRTVGDMFRLVPFSIFIIIPFMELLLPVFIKFFPGMLPSTFQSSSDKEDKIKKSLKAKLEMAKFLQKTLDELPAAGVGHSSEAAKEFAQFFEKVRSSGGMTTSEEIMKFSKLFEDEITLDSLPRPQLMALCRVLDMNPIGTTNFLRVQLRWKLRSLAADDMMISKEGINSLTQSELQAACRARGMRALGVSEERLKAQLSQWLDLSLVKKVPPSLLLLSQAFMLPDTTPTEEKLAATIQALPDAVGTATKAVIGEREGKVDYKTKIDIIKEEVAMIKQERKEQQEEESKDKAKQIVDKKEEILVDPAPTLMDSTGIDQNLRTVYEDIKKTAENIQENIEKLAGEEVTEKEMEALENALETLGHDRKKLLVEKEELQELREEMAEYQEKIKKQNLERLSLTYQDVADLQKMTMASSAEGVEPVKESIAAKLLTKKLNKMIGKLESVRSQLEEKEEKKLSSEQVLTADESKKVRDATLAAQSKSLERQRVLSTIERIRSEEPFIYEHLNKLVGKYDENLRVDDLINTIRKIQGLPNSSLDKITDVLRKMDADKDGVIRVDVVLKMLELVGNEKIKLNKKQITELVDLIDKEEAIEMDEIIYKSLKKSEENEAKVQATATSIPQADEKTTEAPSTTTSSVPSSATDKSDPKNPLNMTATTAASMTSPTITTKISEPKNDKNNAPKELR